MNKLLVLNLEEINEKNNTGKDKEKKESIQNPILFLSPSSKTKKKKSQYSALFSIKNFSSNKQSRIKQTEAYLSNNPHCLSETYIITHEKNINSINKEINGFEEKIIKKPIIKGKNKLVIKCLDDSMKIIKKISKEFQNIPSRVQPKFIKNLQEFTSDKAILAESQKRIEVYKNLFDNIKDNFLEIKAKFNKINIKPAKSQENSIDNEEVNEEGSTNIKEHGLRENGGDSVNEYTINKKLYQEYDSCNIPDYAIQEDSVNKPVTLFSKLNNKLSTIELDLDNDMLVENTIQQFDLTLTKSNSHFNTRDNMKIKYDNKHNYFFRDNNKENEWYRIA